MVKGTFQTTGNGTCQQGLAGTGLTHQNDIGLFDLDLLDLGLVETLVMIVHGDRQDLLGFFLTYHILVQELLDGLRLHDGIHTELIALAGMLHLFFYELLGLTHTILADMSFLTGDENIHLGFRAATEGTVLVVVLFIMQFFADYGTAPHPPCHSLWFRLRSSSNHGQNLLQPC